MTKRLHVCDSCQQWNDSPEALQFYNLGTGFTAVSSGGPFNDRYMNCNTGIAGVRHAFNADTDDEIYVSGYWRTPNIGATSDIYAVYDETGVVHMRTRYNAGTGKIEILRSTTSLGSTATIVNVNTWYCVEMRAKIADSPNGYVHIYLNGSSTADVSLTGIDTRNGGTTKPGQIWFGQQAISNANHFAHLICMTDSTTITTLNGPRIVDFMPNADGSTEQWQLSTGSDSYALVDENPGDTSDTDYIYSSTVGDVTLLEGSNWSFTPTTIHFMTLNTIMRKTDANPRTARGLISSNGSTSYGATQNLSTTYVHYMDPFFVNPSGGGAWDVSSLDAVKFGVELVS